jgi:integrase
MAVNKKGKFFHYEFMIDGRKYRGSTKETVKSRAQTVEALLIAEVRNKGGNVNLRKAPVLREFAVRFLDFVEAQRLSGHLSLATKRYYFSGWELLERTALANMRIDQIGTGDAAVLSFPGGPSNANQAFRTLSRMLHVAVDWRILRAAPRIKLLKELGRTALIGSADEGLLLKHAPQPLADVLVTIMDSGMRPEEAMRMRTEHIFWERNAVLVPYGKTLRSKRYVPLSNRMRQLLSRRANDQSPWVFPSRRSESGHLTTVAKLWRETVKAANLEAAERNLPLISGDLKLYCARHTFATDMLAEGMSVPEVGDLLGHEDLKTTRKYLHPDTTGSSAVVDRRNDARSLHLLKAAS